MQKARSFTLIADVHVPYELKPGPALSMLNLQCHGTEFEYGWPIPKGGRMTFPHLGQGRYKPFLDTEEPIYLKSARLGNQDATGWFTLNGPTTEVLKVEIARATGEVQGAVVNANGKTASGADVKLVARGDDAEYVFKSVQADLQGHFLFSGVPPGKYNLVALHRLVRDSEFGPFEFARLRERAKEIEVGDSTRLTVQVPLSEFRP
jgi:hypothetical protein